MLIKHLQWCVGCCFAPAPPMDALPKITMGELLPPSLRRLLDSIALGVGRGGLEFG